MEANDIAIAQQTPASKQLKAADAASLLAVASKLIVAKGKHVSEFKISKPIPPATVSAMLGPTGNLRAPAIRVGKILIVGYHDEVFAQYLA